MHENIVVSLVYSIYKTILEPERWGLILKECEDLVQADVCDIAAFDFEKRRGGIISHSGYYDQAYVELYEHKYAPLNPWLRLRHRYEMDGAIWVGSELCTHEQLVRTAFFNRWLRPQRLYHRICSTISHDNAGALYFSALRRKDRERFERHELHLAQKLIPHMKQVFELQRLLGTERSARPQPLLEVADNVRDAVLLVGSGGKVLGSNRAGQRLLTGSAQSDSSGALWGKITAAFETASGRSSTPGSQLELNRQDQDDLAVSIIPLPPGTSPDQNDAGVAVIGREIAGNSPTETNTDPSRRTRITWRPLVIHTDRELAEATEDEASVSDENQELSCWGHRLEEPHGYAEANEERLRKIYDFTQAESRVALTLVCGHTVQDCAQRLGVSISTVRTHLQRIFSKTDTHHQGQLVALLLAGPAKLAIECVAEEERSGSYG